jgi:7-cyano-7-deazaguanine synthase
MVHKKRKVLILFSGGIDSTACIHYYKSRNFLIETLFIDFGQLSRKRELSATRRITSFYKIKTNTVHVKGYEDFKSGEIPFRNIFLISAALVNKKKYQGLVSLGIHAGTDYIDCSPTFVKEAQSLLDLYYNGTVLLDTPFINFTKNEIIEYCLVNNIPIHFSYSCELGLNQPCGKCLSCKGLKKIYDSKKLNDKAS